MGVIKIFKRAHRNMEKGWLLKLMIMAFLYFYLVDTFLIFFPLLQKEIEFIFYARMAFFLTHLHN